MDGKVRKNCFRKPNSSFWKPNLPILLVLIYFLAMGSLTTWIFQLIRLFDSTVIFYLKAGPP